MTHPAHRRPGGRAVPRRTSTSSATASSTPFFAGCFGIFGHGNVAGVGQALLRARAWPATRRRPAALPPGPQRAGAWCTPPSATPASATGSPTFACTASVGPGATNMVTGAALATINRLPVLLLPGDIFATRVANPVLQELEDPTLARRQRQRRLPAGLAVLRPGQAARAAAAALLAAMRVLTDPAETGAVTLALPAGRAGRGVRLRRTSCSRSGSGTSPGRRSRARRAGPRRRGDPRRPRAR